jgi:hypothetical protein
MMVAARDRMGRFGFMGSWAGRLRSAELIRMDGNNWRRAIQEKHWALVLTAGEGFKFKFKFKFKFRFRFRSVRAARGVCNGLRIGC